MKYLVSAQSDVGTTKATNQDSVCVKVANTKAHGQVAMAILCDGMGGLEKGEVASATATHAFSEWFLKTLPKRLSDFDCEIISIELCRLVEELNERIWDFGKVTGFKLGTTLSLILFVESQYI